MNDYQIRFLKQYVLGQRTNMDKPSEVIKKCVELADNDMLTGGRFICNQFAKSDKTERVEYILQKLEKNNYRYSKIDKRDVCNDVIWACDEERTINNRRYKPYGFAQKLLNMTYKWLYIYKDYIGKEIDFSKCECPLDSVVLGRLGRQENWTNLTVSQYEDIRVNIQKELEEERYAEMKGEIGELAFDDNWVNSQS